MHAQLPPAFFVLPSHGSIAFAPISAASPSNLRTTTDEEDGAGTMALSTPMHATLANIGEAEAAEADNSAGGGWWATAELTEPILICNNAAGLSTDLDEGGTADDPMTSPSVSTLEGDVETETPFSTMLDPWLEIETSTNSDFCASPHSDVGSLLPSATNVELKQDIKSRPTISSVVESRPLSPERSPRVMQWPLRRKGWPFGSAHVDGNAGLGSSGGSLMEIAEMDSVCLSAADGEDGSRGQRRETVVAEVAPWLNAPLQVWDSTDDSAGGTRAGSLSSTKRDQQDVLPMEGVTVELSHKVEEKRKTLL